MHWDALQSSKVSKGALTSLAEYVDRLPPKVLPRRLQCTPAVPLAYAVSTPTGYIAVARCVRLAALRHRSPLQTLSPTLVQYFTVP